MKNTQAVSYNFQGLGLWIKLDHLYLRGDVYLFSAGTASCPSKTRLFTKFWNFPQNQWCFRHKQPQEAHLRVLHREDKVRVIDVA